jgi:hypothetical protein
LENREEMDKFLDIMTIKNWSKRMLTT